MPVGLVSGEAFLLALLMAAFSLCLHTETERETERGRGGGEKRWEEWREGGEKERGSGLSCLS